MKIIHLWLVVLLCSTIACKKEKKETTVNGRVITYGTDTKATNQPLTIGLFRSIPGSGFGTGERKLYETITDSNGNFEFIFMPEENSENSTYYLRLITQPIAGHYGISYSNQVQLVIGMKQTKNIVLSPYAWVKLHLINNGPYYPGDKIRFTVCGGEIRELYGPVNNQAIYSSGGNSSCRIGITVFRNNESFNLIDTIPFVPAFDTTYYLIEF